MIIKPCPFCKENEVRTMKTKHGNHRVICDDCEATGPLRVNEDDAVNFWNEGDKTTTPIDVDMGYDFAIRWAKAKGWKTPVNDVFPEKAWINYWLELEAYEGNPSSGRPIPPHRSA